MHAPLPKSLNAALPLALVLGLLSGCAEHLETHQTDNAVVGGYRHMFHHGNWQQGPAPFKNYVEPVTLSHDVLFQPGQAALTDAGRKELHAFLRTEGVGTDEQLVLQASQGSDGGHDPLTAARVAALKTEIERSGLTVTAAPDGGDDAQLQPNQIAVSVTRMVVLSPDCDVPPPEPGERPDYRFSCSTTVNLGNMVVNPVDLARGRDFEPSDGEVSARNAKQYRDGDKEAEKIIIEATD
jgi:type IV pilus biogenesis protein CpaD/CtpE